MSEKKMIDETDIIHSDVVVQECTDGATIEI